MHFVRHYYVYLGHPLNWIGCKSSLYCRDLEAEMTLLKHLSFTSYNELIINIKIMRIMTQLLHRKSTHQINNSTENESYLHVQPSNIQIHAFPLSAFWQSDSNIFTNSRNNILDHQYDKITIVVGCGLKKLKLGTAFQHASITCWELSNHIWTCSV